MSLRAKGEAISEFPRLCSGQGLEHLSLDIGICLGFSALDLGFTL
jgi:hypothetical protein